MEKSKILIVDDDTTIADLIELYLNNEDYKVYKFYDSVKALSFLQTENINLAIIDWKMPNIDGIELCQKIREKYVFPIIILTAKTEDLDKIQALMMGADDYMTKPFNPLELLARIKAQLRRVTKYNNKYLIEQQEKIELRGLTMNYKTHESFLNGKELHFTPTEFSILWLLLLNLDRVVSSEEIFETVWHEKYYEANNTVMSHIRRIREKMDEPLKKPKFIQTVWGVGYKIEK